MDIKPWGDYSESEKRKLLHHWWYYYGKMLVTFGEYMEFSELVERDSNSMFRLAVNFYMRGMSSQPLIEAMRMNKVDALFSSLPKLERGVDFDSLYNRSQINFISKIVTTYNNPEADVPMKPSEISSQIDVMKRQRKFGNGNK